MPVSNEWQVQGRIVLMRFREELTAAEVIAANEELQHWIGGEGIAPVHVIADLSDVTRLPANIRELMGKMRVDHPEKSGWTVVISSSPMARFIATVTAQVLHQKVRAASSQAEAWRYLWRIDPTLPPAHNPAPPVAPGV